MRPRCIGCGGDLKTDISLHDSLTAGDQVLFRRLEDEAVLLDLRSGLYFGLNDVGARAWQLIVGHGALAAVLDTLVNEYAAERDVVERDLLALAGQLVARKLAIVAAND
jgi:hypothetical protein